MANSVFYIAVKESADAPYKFYYYTKDDLNAYDEAKAARYREMSALWDASDISVDPDTLTVRYTLDGTEHWLPCPLRWKNRP